MVLVQLNQYPSSGFVDGICAGVIGLALFVGVGFLLSGARA